MLQGRFTDLFRPDSNMHNYLEIKMDMIETNDDVLEFYKNT